MKEKLTSLLCDLIRIPSITARQDKCAEAIDYVESLFRLSPFKLTRYVNDSITSLCISKKSSLNFDILFLAHLDVVPGDKGIFEPKIKGDWLYGRGALDMKGPASVLIELFYKHQSDPLFENYGLVLTTDEEIGGDLGINHLIQEHGLRAKIVFNPDGGPNFSPCVSEKGLVHMKLRTKGVSCHASRCWTGRNAIELLIQDIDNLKNSFDYASNDDQLKPSLNVGKFSGGLAINQVPDSAEASIDFRYPAEMTEQETINKLTEAIKYSEIEFIHTRPPMEVNTSSDSFLDLCQAIKINGLAAETTHGLGSSDSVWFMPQGSQLLMIYPEGSGLHQEDERVNLQSLCKLYDIIETFIRLRHNEIDKDTLVDC